MPVRKGEGADGNHCKTKLLLKDKMRWSSANYVTAIKKLGLIAQSSQSIEISSHASWNANILWPVFNWLPSSPPFKAGLCQSHQPPTLKLPWKREKKNKGQKSRAFNYICFRPNLQRSLFFLGSRKVTHSESFDLEKQKQKLGHPVLIMFFRNLI